METALPSCFGFRQLTLDTILDASIESLKLGLL